MVAIDILEGFVAGFSEEVQQVIYNRRASETLVKQPGCLEKTVRQMVTTERSR